MGWCRACGYIWMPDKEKPPTREEFEAWRRQQLENEHRRKVEAEKAIALLKSEKIWHYYHSCLNDYAVKVLNDWGIRKDWADRWKLGLIADYTVFHKGQEPYHSPAISIPIWQLNSNVPKNIKVRVLNPRVSADRYRAIYKTGQDSPFFAFPTMKHDTALVVEGEKKAMVCAEWSGAKYQVVGIPTKTPSPESLSVLDSFDNLVVCLDPDASVQDGNGNSPLKRMVSILGRERVRVAELYDKIDDMIVNYKLRPDSVMKYAKKLEVK